MKGTTMATITSRECLIMFIGIACMIMNGAIAGGQVFDITENGAKGDGKTRSEMAIIKTWKAACNSGGDATVVIPPGTFVAGEIVFTGSCKGTITIDIQGTLMATGDLSDFSGLAWISVERVDKVIVTTSNGKGTINGAGSKVWSHNKGGGAVFPVSFQFNFAGNSKLLNVNFVDSMGFHTKVTDSHDILVDNIKVTAPGDSPNTDGCHTSNAVNTVISNSHFATGDDCVSMGQGTKGLKVIKCSCGPGHGYSVGSLGKRTNENNVNDITVSGCSLSGTTNGLRIKTYHGSPELTASSITFEDITMDNVKNPIIIDQHYDSSHSSVESKVQLSGIHFRGIRGTCSTPVAINLMCSKSHPCQGVELTDINLSGTSVCENVKGASIGKMSAGLSDGCKASASA